MYQRVGESHPDLRALHLDLEQLMTILRQLLLRLKVLYADNEDFKISHASFLLWFPIATYDGERHLSTSWVFETAAVHDKLRYVHRLTKFQLIKSSV